MLYRIVSRTEVSLDILTTTDIAKDPDIRALFDEVTITHHRLDTCRPSCGGLSIICRIDHAPQPRTSWHNGDRPPRRDDHVCKCDSDTDISCITVPHAVRRGVDTAWRVSGVESSLSGISSSTHGSLVFKVASSTLDISQRLTVDTLVHLVGGLALRVDYAPRQLFNIGSRIRRAVDSLLPRFTESGGC